MPVLKIANIKDGRVLLDGCGFVSPEKAETIPEWYTRENDVLIAMTGYVGEVALIKPNERYLINQRVGRFEFIKDSVIEKKFFFYFLRLKQTRQYLENVARGSAQANLSSQDIADMKIPIPPLPEQRRIAHILGTLDDKIENNRKTAKTLEAMAQAIFKSWFVDFDPVRAKMAGESRESICKRLKLAPEILDLFPDRLVDSELGEIPEGWRVGNIGDMFGFQNGYAFESRDWQDQGVPVIKIGSVKPGFVDMTNVSYVSEKVADQAKEYQLMPADLVISMTGYVGEVALIPKTSVCPMLNQRVGRFVLDGRDTQYVAFAYCFTRQPSFKMAVESVAHGTAQANVSSGAIMSITAIIPNHNLRSKFNSVCKFWFDKLLAYHEASAVLSRIRESLLPKLISGEIRTSEAEHFLET